MQFGRPIGSFQALKHRMADLYVARAVGASGGRRRRRRTHPTSAPRWPGWPPARPSCTVAGEAIQLHGGIAITWEHDIQLYFKRAHGSAQLFGPPSDQLRQLESEVF